MGLMRRIQTKPIADDSLLSTPQDLATPKELLKSLRSMLSQRA
jgi:hypothetical protein